jgi:hypothetical protein
MDGDRYVIIRDAMRDVCNVHAFVTRRYAAAPTMCILEGQSMGGAIVTRLAERRCDLFAGVLAVGAALMTRADRQSRADLRLRLLHAPQMPLLYLTNESELGAIEGYVNGVAAVRDAATGAADVAVLPAVWTVERAGHNWTNERERFAAIVMLVRWIAYGTFITKRRANGTQPTRAVASSIIRTHDGGSGVGRVVEVLPGGRVVTSFVAVDMFVLGVGVPGSRFEITVAPPQQQQQRRGSNGDNSAAGDDVSASAEVAVGVSAMIPASIQSATFDATFDVYPFVRTGRDMLSAHVEAENGRVVLDVHSVAAYASAADWLGRVRTGDVLQFARRDGGSAGPGKLDLTAFDGAFAGLFGRNKAQTPSSTASRGASKVRAQRR